jgi:hypothetical protein
MGFGIGPIELLFMGLLCVVPLGGIAVVVFMGLLSRQRARQGLVPCKTCRQYLSPEASTCPHCGQPTPVA